MQRAGLIVVLFATAAGAHDGLHGQTGAASTNEIDATIAVTTFHFASIGDRSGEVVTVLPAVRAASAWRLWAEVALPVHYVQVVGDSDAGPGDLMAGLGYGLLRAGAWSVDVAVWSMWPTGNPFTGLGAGHVMIAPHVAARVDAGRFSFGAGAMLRGAIPFGDHADHHHQPPTAPHDLVDVQLTQRGAVRLAERLELCAHLEEVVVAVPHPSQPIGTRAAAGVGAALTFGDFRADVRFTAPITRRRAWDWQLGASLTYRFSAPATDPQSAGPSPATHPSGH